MHKNHKGRETVLKLLYEYEITKNPMEMILKNSIVNKIKGKDLKNFVFNSFSGILSNIPFLDSLIQKYLQNWQIERVAIIEKNILRIAIYELFNHKDIPAAVIIDDAIELSKTYGSEISTKFINGILDCILHQELDGRIIKTK